jgi:hypothetical protein
VVLVQSGGKGDKADDGAAEKRAESFAEIKALASEHA